ncbi:SUPPRESSOR OF GAMMA RESPONSE 1-like [Iris pallida]|uniref:SUPPRESSOR OF GAMMA RESPONSE 1-like n=1 Tax=Iris pallida TaxID=29817 RepID=A0AAX6FTL6_IRIPA|nr:SUPPRESSOR OF GAMMA RESPONSE 1-like [Iris pallida]
MTGPSWLIDSKRIATKIKNASDTVDPSRARWISNPTKACPRCNYNIDNSDVVQEWPGLPRGVKFDPSDQELLSHLLAKLGKGGGIPHPFINEFIPTVDESDGICYTHPQKLPGVKQDGSVSHFFHRTFRAYNSGTRKRRKIQQNDDEHTGRLSGDVRWHKTGKTKPVIIDGEHVGCKKIMVLYSVLKKGGKPEKTNWVMHQYHLGTGEDEKDGEFVVSKVFFQQQQQQQQQQPQLKSGNNIINEGDEALDAEATATTSPQVETEAGTGAPEHHADNKQQNPGQTSSDHLLVMTLDETLIAEATATTAPQVEPEAAVRAAAAEAGTRAPEHLADNKQKNPGKTSSDQVTLDNETAINEGGADQIPLREATDEQDNDSHLTTEEDTKWWEGESQYLLDSQQLAEGLALCDEFLMSQSSCGGGAAEETKRIRPCLLSEYARAGGADDFKKDLEDCQALSINHSAAVAETDQQHAIDELLNTPPDMRLSQLEFGSQDIFLE